MAGRSPTLSGGYQVTGKIDKRTLDQWRQERQRQAAHLAHRQRRLEAARHNRQRLWRAVLPWLLAAAVALLVAVARAVWG